MIHNHWHNEIKRLQGILNAPKTFPDYLASPKSRTILTSLNTRFAQLNARPSPDAIATIDKFSELFELHENKAQFLGEDFGTVVLYNKEDIKKQTQLDLTCAKTKLSIAKEKRERFSPKNAASEQELSQKREKAEQEWQNIKSDYELIRSFATIRENINRFNEDIKRANEKINQLTEEKADLQIEFDKASSDFNKIKEERQDFFDKGKLFPRWKDRLDKFAQQFPEVLSNSADYHSKKTPLTSSFFDQLIDRLSTLFELKEERNKACSILLDKGLIEVDRYKIPDEAEEMVIAKQCDEFSGIYQNLSNNRKHLETKEETYNEKSGVIQGIIIAAQNNVETFQQDLNKEISQYQISNLSSVKIEIELNPAFKSLVSELKQISGDKTSGTKRFYNVLKEFKDKFFDTRRDKLKISMDKIIASVKHRSIKNNDALSESKEQSNGTTLWSIPY